MLPTALLNADQLEHCRRILALAVAPSLTQMALAPLQEAIGEDGPQAVAARYLGAGERERFLSFGYAKRQAEWLGGRLAAKAAAQRWCAPTVAVPERGWGQWEIYQNRQGKPFITGVRPAGASNPAISISHSDGLAVAMATGSGSCGIDLQKITPTLAKVRERFATEEELAVLHQAECLSGVAPLAKLALLWSAKEALRKAKERTPLLGFLEMRLWRLHGERELGLALEFAEAARSAPPEAPDKISVYTTFHNRFACAITVVLS